MLKTKFTPTKVIVDLSYMVHYRIAASYKFYISTFEDLPYTKETIQDYDWTLDDEFMRMYEYNFLKNLSALLKKHKVSFKDVILARDCSKKNIWRKDLLPIYKDNRIITEEDQKGNANFGTVWNYTYKILLPRLCEEKGCHLIYNDSCEGDDVVAIVKNYIRRCDPKQKIVICANDSDLAQLVTDSYVSIWDLKLKNVDQKVIDRYDGSPHNIVKVKCLAGDGKDNVDQAFPRVGLKTALKILKSPELFKEYLEKHPDAKTQIKLNEKLLDFKHIPAILVEDVEKQYKEKVIGQTTSDLLDL
jgi:5'-3' exonuclease